MSVQIPSPVTPLMQHKRTDGNRCCLFDPICAIASFCFFGITGAVFLSIGMANRSYCHAPYADPCTPADIENGKRAVIAGIVMLALAGLSVVGAIFRCVGEKALNRKAYHKIGLSDAEI